jgi:hypothetical protein
VTGRGPLIVPVRIGVAVALLCGAGSFALLHWLRAAYAPAGELVASMLIPLLGMPLGALSGTIGFLAGRWWWRRSLRRRTIDG